VKAGADVNLQDKNGSTPLINACCGGHASVVKELIKAGADVNLQDKDGNTPLMAAIINCCLSTVRCLVEHGAVWVTQVVDIKMPFVYRTLIWSKPDIVKYTIQEQNEIRFGKFQGNVNLFNCLVGIRHAGVTTNSRDDVVVTDRSVWCLSRWGDMWRTISFEDCDILRRLLCLGLDVNQSIQLYDSEGRSDGVRPLLYVLIDEEDVRYKTEKVGILIRAGADINFRVTIRKQNFIYHSVLDREGVSILESTKRWVCGYNDKEYILSRGIYKVPEKRVMCDIKKHVRRYSV
jgi:ankyrin repeat protein